MTVFQQFKDNGGAFISLTRLHIQDQQPTWWQRMRRREPAPIEVREELRSRKWARIHHFRDEDGWLSFEPVEFDLPPGHYVAATARLRPGDDEPLAVMQLRQALPVAGRVRITPKIKVDA